MTIQLVKFSKKVSTQITSDNKVCRLPITDDSFETTESCAIIKYDFEGGIEPTVLLTIDEQYFQYSDLEELEKFIQAAKARLIKLKKEDR